MSNSFVQIKVVCNDNGHDGYLGLSENLITSLPKTFLNIEVYGMLFMWNNLLDLPKGFNDINRESKTIILRKLK